MEFHFFFTVVFNALLKAEKALVTSLCQMSPYAIIALYYI